MFATRCLVAYNGIDSSIEFAYALPESISSRADRSSPKRFRLQRVGVEILERRPDRRPAILIDVNPSTRFFFGRSLSDGPSLVVVLRKLVGAVEGGTTIANLVSKPVGGADKIPRDVEMRLSF